MARQDACAEQADAVCAGTGDGCRIWYGCAVCQIAGPPVRTTDQDACLSALGSAIAGASVIGYEIPEQCRAMWFTGH